MRIRNPALLLAIVVIAGPQVAKAHDFVAVAQKINPVVQPKQPIDAIAEGAKDPTCSTVVSTAASHIGVSPNLVTAAMAAIPTPRHVGEESFFSISLPGDINIATRTSKQYR
jgi:hypothetical protein